MKAYVFPSRHKAKVCIEIDFCNRTMPSKVCRGPHTGKLYLDEALAERDPRWIPIFQPLIADPANEVELVDLDVIDTIPLSFR